MDLRELDWKLLESTEDLSDDKVLDLASIFRVDRFGKWGQGRNQARIGQTDDGVLVAANQQR